MLGEFSICESIDFSKKKKQLLNAVFRSNLSQVFSKITFLKNVKGSQENTFNGVLYL